MLQRKIQEDDGILKEKPHYNYFHKKDYTLDQRKCDNCFEGETGEEMLYCESCNSFIHRSCYGLSDDLYELVELNETEDELGFTFIKCESCQQREEQAKPSKSKVKIEGFECFLCKRNIGIMRRLFLDERPVVYASTKKNEKISQYEYRDTKQPVLMPQLHDIKFHLKQVFAHPLCVNTCSCLFIFLSKLLLVWNEKDYQEKKRISKQQKCSLCKVEGGFLISCESSKRVFPSCKQFFHPFCGAEMKIIYYQQGMRAILQDPNVKYNQLSTTQESEESATYYYILCPSHISEIFLGKLRTGYFSQEKRFIEDCSQA